MVSLFMQSVCISIRGSRALAPQCLVTCSGRAELASQGNSRPSDSRSQSEPVGHGELGLHVSEKSFQQFLDRGAR